MDTTKQREHDAGEIKPALTAEEWKRVEVTDTSVGLRVADDYELPEDVDEAFEILVQLGDNTHRTAALCLRGQPFGFTSLQAYAIRQLIQHARITAEGVGSLHALWDSIFCAEEAADRIEALLPPEDT